MTPISISSWGSADPKNQETVKQFNIAQPENLIGTLPTMSMNPMMEKFSSLFGNPTVKDTLLSNPGMQNTMFDVDNFIKSQAGIFRQKDPNAAGLQDFGLDSDGKPLYALQDTMEGKDFDWGKNKLYNTGTLLQSIGAFSDDEEADSFAKMTDLAGDPTFMGTISGLAASGDKKGAVNTILSEFGHPTLEALEKNPGDKKAMSLAFASYGLVDNLDKMSPAQQSMALSGMGLASFKYKDGKTLNQKALLSDADGNTTMTVGDAFALAGQGKNVHSLMKNYDQIDVMQRLTFGKGSVMQMASTADRMGMLGSPENADGSIKLDTAQLGSLGFKAVPSAGLGAITGPANALPEGYEAVGSGNNENQVIAVPKGMSSFSSTINGTVKITSLNSADGITPAGVGAFKTQAGWLKAPARSEPNGVAGSAFSAGLQSSGVLKDPYLASAIATTSTFANTISNKLPAPQNFDQAVAQTGVNSPLRKQQVNIQQVAKKNQDINTAIATGKSVSDIMAKNVGSSDAKAVSPYINAAAAGKRLYDVMNDPNATDKQKKEAVAAAGQAGTNIASQLGNQTAGSAAPGVNVAMAAYNASKILDSDMSDKEKSEALRKTGEDTAAAYYTFGLSSVAQFADQKWTGGKGDEIRTKIRNLDPVNQLNDKLLETGLGAFSGGKSKEQQGRDKIRAIAKQSGLVNSDWKVTLADGSMADIGKDGNSEKHQFTNPDKVIGQVRDLNPYDVDYTNDLDFSSNMMTSALTRLMAGGKGTSIDQVAGEFANAALGNVGFGQDMTEENFAKVRDNARGFFVQKGIKSKEDAYALSNQMFAEGRITEMDAVSIQQGINMAFDDNGYDTAQVLMSGRWKGLETAADIAQAPGPNFGSVAVDPKMPSNIDPGFEIKPEEFDTIFKGGSYEGPKNASVFTKAMSNYKDKWIDRKKK